MAAMRRWILETDELTSLLDDRGLTHGLGVFETMLAIDGRLVGADWHFDRLQNGCERLGITPANEKRILESLHAALDDEALARARVRVTRTGGSGLINNVIGRDARTLLSIAPCPVPPESVRVMTSPWRRNEHSPLAGVKCTSYAENLLALNYARRHEVDELIFGNTAGELCEAATANIFLVRDGRISTPSDASGCLPGTAASRVLMSAQVEGIETERCGASLDEARDADEVFLTSATRGVVAVSEWDGKRYPVGAVTMRLRGAFERMLLE